ncbi:MAG: hypothetical protein JXA97_10165 [Anaerolineales bacterium]|nr:hypothetical protein [Anaerolineales bacterium]
MTRQPSKDRIKKLLGNVPGAASWYQNWIARGRNPSAGYDLARLETAVQAWASVLITAAPPQSGKRILLVGSLRWWLEYTTALAVLLRSQGHRVDLAYLPYRRWTETVSRFDAQRQAALIEHTLSPLAEWMDLLNLSAHPVGDIPGDVDAEILEQSRLDVQYTLQREDVDWEEDVERDLLALRLERNRIAAGAALDLFSGGEYDTVLIPNGSILEFGSIYRVARHTGTQVVTFEFGEQRERMWLAQNAEVMRLDTSALWDVRGGIPLTLQEEEAVKTLYQARRGGKLWKNFSRQWQAGDHAGSRKVRAQLNLDPDRPLALLCTNVVGDSLALDRQVFTEGMEDWLTQTVQYFKDHPEVQLVVRVHPGELLGAGHPSVDIVRSALPDLPEHVILVPPESKINTYDLIEMAQLGLVYTTTVGMEMAMAGLPVVVAGATHYRGKGFTYDPETLAGYVDTLDRLTRDGKTLLLSDAQVELAWRYAHRFFFEYPFPFPWHLVTFWEDLAERSLTQVVLENGTRVYERTLQALAGDPLHWKMVD